MSHRSGTTGYPAVLRRESGVEMALPRRLMMTCMNLAALSFSAGSKDNPRPCLLTAPKGQCADTCKSCRTESPRPMGLAGHSVAARPSCPFKITC